MAIRLPQLRAALGFGASLVRNEVRALLRMDPDRREAALAFAREHASSGDPESILRALDRFARERRFLMNVGDEKGPLLEDLVRKAGPTARVLELGSFVGYSAILMAQHLEAPGRVVSIDASPTARHWNGCDGRTGRKRRSVRWNIFTRPASRTCRWT